MKDDDMTFGIPLEVHSDENRVGATPFLVNDITQRGYSVFVETHAGEKSGFSDLDYEAAGATICPSPEKLYVQANHILKIREPQPVEYDLIHPDHTIFAFLGFFYQLDKCRSLLARGCTCFAYEMLQIAGIRPLLIAEAQISGQLAIQQGANYLLSANNGRGILLNGFPNAPAANVSIIGSSSAALSAAKYADECGSKVTLFYQSSEALESLEMQLPPSIQFQLQTQEAFEASLPKTDMLISAMFDIENEFEQPLNEEWLKKLPESAIVIDLDIDYGGGFDISSATRWDRPVLKRDHYLYYAISNLPSAVQKTASIALSHALTSYILRFCDNGFLATLKADSDLLSGLIFYEGRITNKRLADMLEMGYYNLQELNEDS